MQAVSFVNQTNRNIFLTGKAGTGKTTFLRYIRENSHKKMAVAAPTGVAAMNAGGTTLHALFWLPFGAFIENHPMQWNEQDNHVYNKGRLFKAIKLTTPRRNLLCELELLVIDEVSMVRADILDAIDVILKSVRRDARPFGGLQMLFIGDLYQLPPVVRDHEWQLLRGHYTSPFFFDAKVLREQPPVMLELSKIYRQSDPVFIDMLNKIRNNQCATADLEDLNRHFRPDFVPEGDDRYITLTSHNQQAEAINRDRLAKLPGRAQQVKARIKDDFQSGAFPADEVLSLKVGAQVMFIKNDSGEERRYFNGKIGTVRELHLDNGENNAQVVVGFDDGSDDVAVRRETWDNIRYKYDKREDKIEEQVLGTFSQFPLRLAWAITIHKSQGLTFDRAVIDAGTSFAAGQVYVALSRLTALDGLVLQSKIPPQAIRTDPQVVQFMQHMLAEDQIPAVLEAAQRSYMGQVLLRGFRWAELTETAEELRRSLAERSIPDRIGVERHLDILIYCLKEQEKVANKFTTWLQQMLNANDKAEPDYAKICERTKSAVAWFLPRFVEEVVLATQEHIGVWKAKKRTKRYTEDQKAMLSSFLRKKEQLEQCLTIANILTRNEVLSADVDAIRQTEKPKNKASEDA